MTTHFNNNTFESEVLKSTKPVLIDFYADWCGPCKMMAPVIDEMARDYDGKAVVGKLNVDENMEIAQSYRVMSIPTLIIFKDGQAVERIVGATSKSSLSDALNKHI